MIAGPQMIYVTVGKFHINYISTTARQILFFPTVKADWRRILGKYIFCDAQKKSLLS